ncbi:hypothetical protein ACOMHN_024829 [Nucella lapillus]
MGIGGSPPRVPGTEITQGSSGTFLPYGFDTDYTGVIRYLPYGFDTDNPGVIRYLPYGFDTDYPGVIRYLPSFWL